ncbi:MAG: hypothetical protein V4448_17805 [Pseudomonadota bacterium]
MKEFVPIVVALAPAIVCALVGFVVEVVPLLQAFIVREIYSSVAKLEWLKEIVSHASFYGVAVTGLTGIGHEAPGFYYLAAGWFFACQMFTLFLVKRLERLELLDEDKAKVRWRKTAGMIRSIVKDELSKSASKNWSDNGG